MLVYLAHFQQSISKLGIRIFTIFLDQLEQVSEVIHVQCFVHPIFRCLVLVTFVDKVTKISHFARHGQDEKKTERKSRN